MDGHGDARSAAWMMFQCCMIWAVAIQMSCSDVNAAYCDEDKPCVDPTLSYCDLTGASGSRNQCVEPPDGGGPPPGSRDAAPGSRDAAPGSSDAAPGELCAGVDCSAFDDACNRGVCDPEIGECAAQPINEDMECAEPVCGELGPCGGFNEPCGEIGTAERSCQDLTCQAGACVVGPSYQDEQDCSRDTDGLTCDRAETSCGLCGGFSSACDESGTRTCTETTFECSSGTCDSSSTSSTEACSRITDGVPCDSRSCNFGQGTQQLCCNSSQSCSVVCGECITPGAPVFR